MATPEFEQQEHQLIQALDEALAHERELRTTDQREAFTARVMNSVPIQRFGFSSKTWSMLTAAAAIIAVTVFWFADSDDYERQAREIRRAAIKLPVLANTYVIEAAEAFDPIEGEQLVLVGYEYLGEHCLWMFPEKEIDWNQADDDFRQKRKWRARIRNGRVTVSPEAVIHTFGTVPENLVMMQIGTHFEIWDREALARFTGENG